MNQTNCSYRHVFLCALFSILFMGVQAQPESVKAELKKADDNYTDQKFAEARNTYLKYPQHLSGKQQYHLAMSTVAVGQSDAKLQDEGLRGINKLADEGLPIAMITLAVFYQNGFMVEKDPAKEVYWLEKAAAKDDEDALILLAGKFAKGKGVAADMQKAKEYYLKAERKGNKSAAYYLGVMALEDGHLSSALAYLKTAADGRIPGAMMKLAAIYEEGKGLGRKDLDKAVYWYTKASDASKDYDTRYQARLKIEAIGRMEPPTDINTVKPLLLKLITRAGSGYGGLLSETVVPLDHYIMEDVFGKSTYYTTTVDLGFKKGMVKKVEHYGKKYGDVQMKSGTEYSYNAEIINSATEKDAARVFEKWKSLLKETVPGWKREEGKEPDNRSPYFRLSGYLENGTKVTINMTLCCPALDEKRIIFTISNE
ncbi:MAG: tetratricopeptide repeat protein [Chitinophagaceae bacterium]